MADIQSNIKIGFDTAEALSNLKNLQREISAFHMAMAKGSSANATAAANLQKDLINNINATGKFAASLSNIKTTTESFTNSLERNKFTMGEYFKFSMGASKTFGRFFKKEFDIVGKVARERVKDLQTQYISLGRDANGALKGIKIRPLMLDLDSLATKTQIATQRQQLFNQLLKQGSTNLLNWGKNTQWAGRQLMVGFTVPLSIFGSKAAATFMELEKQVIQFKRVYGELGTTQEATDAMAKQVQSLATEFTKYGVTVEQTMGLAAEAAATGATGADLLAQVTEATRLAVLGNVDQSQSLETSIAMTNAFGIASEDLAKKIDFLNAVENQTVTSIEDLTIAIPKAGPVVKQLGGSVEDLAFFLTAMKEGGINASEGANALKSGLASIINPTQKAKDMLGGMGINIEELVSKNKGNVKQLVTDLGALLNQLDPLSRSQAIEQVFGKFQFSRLSTLFQNVTAQGTQAQRVLDLTNASAQELANLSGKELSNISDSTTYKFERAIADLKAAIAPVGEEFLKAITPIVNFGTTLVKNFNKLDDGTKQVITNLTLLFAGLGPVILMTVGLIGNGIANVIKGFAAISGVFARLKGAPRSLGDETDYMTQQQLEAHAVASSLDQIHAQLKQTFTSEAAAVDMLTAAYERSIAAQARYGGPKGAPSKPRKKFAGGGMVVGPGGPKDDMVPADLSNGEAVIDAETVKKNPEIIAALFAGKKIIIPGYARNNSSSFNVDLPSKTQTGAPREVFAHIGTSIETTVAELVGALRDAGAVVKRDLADLQRSGLGNSRARVYGGLGFTTSEDVNQQLAKQGASPSEMLKDWDSRGLGKWSTSLKIAGIKQEDVATDLEIYDKSIKDAIASAAALDDSFKVTDGFIEEISNKTLQELETSGSKLAEAWKRAAAHATEYRTSPTKGEMLAAGFGQDPSRPEDPKYMMSENGVRIKAGRGAKKSARTARGLGLPVGAMAELETAGAEVVDSATKSVVKGAKKRAKIQSPSKETESVGENLSEGAIKGMRSQSKNAEKAGEDLAASTVKGTRKGARKASSTDAAGSTGTPVIVAGRTKSTKEDDATSGVVKETGNRLAIVNDRIQKVSFAMTTLAGAGMMAGGQIGEVSSIIFQVSGAMYGLMAVTELLTSTKLLELAASRAKATTDAMNAAAGLASGTKLFQGFTKVGTGVSGFFKTIGAGIKTFGANLLRLGGFIVRFLGPIGLAIGAITALVGIVNLINDAKEKERVKVEGLGDAAQITADKLSLMESLLGETATVTPLEAARNAKTAPGGLEAATAETRTRVEAIKSDQGFQDAYKGSIEQLKGATDSAAKAVLQSLAINMKGKGFSDQAVQDWLMAIRESAGKLNIEITPESIDFNKEESRKSAIAAVGQLGKDFTEAVKQNPDFGKSQQIAITSGNMVTGYVTKVNDTLTTDAQSKLNAFTSSMESTINGLSGMLQAGTIDTENFTKTFSELSGTMAGMPEPTQMFILNDLLANSLNPEIANQAQALTNSSDKMLLLQAAAAGVTNISPALITALQNETSSQWGAVQAAQARLQIQNQLNAALAGYAGVNAVTTTVGITTTKYSGGGSKQTTQSPFQKAVESLKEQRQEIAYANKAYGKLRKAGLSIADAFEAAKDPIIAAAVATTKVGTKEWKRLLGLIKAVAKEQHWETIRDGIRELTAKNKLDQSFADIIPVLSSIGLEMDQIQEIMNNPEMAKQLAAELKDGKLNSNEMYNYLKQIEEMKKIAIQIQLSTPEGMEDAVNNAFSDIQGYFAAQEEAITLDFRLGTNETGKNAGLINIGKIEEEIKQAQSLIDGYNNQIDDMEASLYWMEQQETKINDAYDKRIESLDEIADINNRISEDQQAQLTVADALTQGDIAAAAKAMYEYRQQQAQTRLEDQKSMLENARERALGALRDKNGKSRKQIEEDILSLKNKIYQVEEDTLEPAQIALNSATQILEKQISSLEYLEKSKEEWTQVQAGVNLAKVEAEGYKKAIEDALALIPQLKDAWAGVGAQDLNDLTTSPTTTKATTKATTTAASGGGSGSGKKTNPAWTAQKKVVTDTQTKLDKLKGQAAAASKAITSLQNQINSLSGVAGMSSVVASLKNDLAGKKTEASYIASSIVMVNSDLTKAKNKLAGIPQYLSRGGMVKPKYMSLGGVAKGLSRGTDNVPAMLTPGEFVVKKYAVDQFGVDNLKAINNGTFSGGSVYNSYEVNVNVTKSDANAGDIARVVIDEIKRIDSQRIRGNKL